ncbi:hypothetical protein FHN55_17015 [Streptomyces sp. NP160]|uniref:hypothetical protein n=1 Tax=Streptomyces sp. NP160 TaxID=2586637 RepID=UPI001119633D|nr:hypothetical protein [Streptomyces sp. NP160]TNM61529.1 hypothetical protein FHN55_17015 [Streptomyces sp. NP160]
MVGPYEKSVKRFLKTATWLTDADDPMVIHLKTIAQSLDKQLEQDGAVQSALANTFGVTWGRLKAPKATKDDVAEEDDDLLFS